MDAAAAEEERLEALARVRWLGRVYSRLVADRAYAELGEPSYEEPCDSEEPLRAEAEGEAPRTRHAGQPPNPAVSLPPGAPLLSETRVSGTLSNHTASKPKAQRGLVGRLKKLTKLGSCFVTTRRALPPSCDADEPFEEGPDGLDDPLSPKSPARVPSGHTASGRPPLRGSEPDEVFGGASGSNALVPPSRNRSGVSPTAADINALGTDPIDGGGGGVGGEFLKDLECELEAAATRADGASLLGQPEAMRDRVRWLGHVYARVLVGRAREKVGVRGSRSPLVSPLAGDHRRSSAVLSFTLAPKSGLRSSTSGGSSSEEEDGDSPLRYSSQGSLPDPWFGADFEGNGRSDCGNQGAAWDARTRSSPRIRAARPPESTRRLAGAPSQLTMS